MWKRGMTWIQFCGPDGKLPPDTADKDARRYRSVTALDGVRLLVIAFCRFSVN